MKQFFSKFEYTFFICQAYIRCFTNPNAQKANHHCVIGFVFSYSLIFLISSLPGIIDFKNEVIGLLHNNDYAITCFLYTYYTTLMFLSVVGSVGFVNIYSKPFFNFAVNDAFVKNKNHIVLQMLKDNNLDLFEIEINHSDKLRSLDISSQFDIFFNQNRLMLYHRLTPLNKLCMRNKFFIEYGKDSKYAFEKIKAYLGMDAFDYKDYDLNEFFKVAMLNNGKPINFYTLYNQWLCLTHDFPNKLFLNILNNEMLDFNIQMYAQTFDADFPEDFITLSLILSGDIAKVKGHAGSGGYSTHTSFKQYINRRLKHPFNEKYLSYNDLEPYPLNNLVQFIPALIFGFKMTHIEQLIDLKASVSYIKIIMNTMSSKDKMHSAFMNISNTIQFDESGSSLVIR